MEEKLKDLFNSHKITFLSTIIIALFTFIYLPEALKYDIEYDKITKELEIIDNYNDSLRDYYKILEKIAPKQKNKVDSTKDSIPKENNKEYSLLSFKLVLENENELELLKEPIKSNYSWIDISSISNKNSPYYIEQNKKYKEKLNISKIKTTIPVIKNKDLLQELIVKYNEVLKAAKKTDSILKKVNFSEEIDDNLKKELNKVINNKDELTYLIKEFLKYEKNHTQKDNLSKMLGNITDLSKSFEKILSKLYYLSPEYKKCQDRENSIILCLDYQSKINYFTTILRERQQIIKSIKENKISTAEVPIINLKMDVKQFSYSIPVILIIFILYLLYTHLQIYNFIKNNPNEKNNIKNNLKTTTWILSNIFSDDWKNMLIPIVIVGGGYLSLINIYFYIVVITWTYYNNIIPILESLAIIAFIALIILVTFKTKKELQ